MAARVALDCRLLDWPGVGRYCLELAAALIEAAPDLSFFWLCSERDRGRLPVAPNAAPLVVGARPFSVAEQFVLPWALKRHGIGLLHAPTPTTLPIVPMLAPRLVVTVHDLILRRFPEFLPNPIGRAYYRFMTRAAVGMARRIVTVSEFTRLDVAKSWPRFAGKTQVILNGVGPSFEPLRSREKLREVSARLKLPDNYILYIGTRKLHKNLPRLLEAYGLLSADRRARCPFVLVAAPDRRYPEVEDVVARTGIASDLHWLSNLADADLPALYAGARFVALMSVYEGFGFPVAEGQACGTPALVADVTALPEVTADGGIYADPYDVASIHSGLQRLVDDDAVRADLARKGLRNATRFRWERAATELAAVYREALA
jgi:glycosyltransferase involved in cell wall biosynthesis